MSWRGIGFLHWRVPERRLRRLLPSGLELDLHEGHAFVSLVAVRNAMRLGAMPVADVAQVNLRTYVRRGRERGIFLLGVYCGDPLAADLARFAGLPYWDAEVDVRPGAAVVRDQVEATWQPGAPAAGSLEDFLVERYHLYSPTERGMLRFDVEHEPFQLRQASATLGTSKGLPRGLRRSPDLAHAADDVEVTMARPVRIE